jgi:hypothetical protein
MTAQTLNAPPADPTRATQTRDAVVGPRAPDTTVNQEKEQLYRGDRLMVLVAVVCILIVVVLHAVDLVSGVFSR